MRTFFNSKLLVLLALVINCNVACDISSDKDKNNDVLVVDQKNDTEQTESLDNYPILSPDEMMSLLITAQLKYNPVLINDTEAYKKYLTSNSVALNLGVYSTNLAYSMYFKDMKNSIKLLKVIEMIKEDMHININNDHMIERVRNNIHNQDSLYEITNTAYYNLMSSLYDADREVTFVAIALGSFIESLYIAVNSVDKYSADNETIELIAEHKLTLSNFLNIMRIYKEDPVIAGTQKHLDELKKQFDNFDSISEESTETATTAGSFTIGGGEKIIISNAQFDLLKTTLIKIRNEITLN